MAIHIGTAPDSWGVWFPKDERQIDWRRCLDEMAEAGYQGVELGPWGYLPNDYETLKAELDNRNLSLVAGTAGADFSDDASVDLLCVTLKDICALLKQFDTAKYVVLLPDMYTDAMTGADVLPRELSEDAWKRLFTNMDRLVRLINGYGLVPALHPHVDSHIQTEDDIERILDNTDMTLCLDTGHHIYGGGDPVSFYKKHYRSIPFMHVKECDVGIKERMKAEGWSFAKAVAEGIMCEPGLGGIDFRELFNFMKQIGYDGWVVVEQDMYPVGDFNSPVAMIFPFSDSKFSYGAS